MGKGGDHIGMYSGTTQRLVYYRFLLIPDPWVGDSDRLCHQEVVTRWAQDGAVPSVSEWGGPGSV